MTLWTSDKYNASIKKLSLSQKQTLNHGGSAQTSIRTNIHICVPWRGYFPGEKSCINPSMRQLMVERGIPNGKVAPSLQHLMDNGGRKSRPTIVMYVCGRKSSV